MGRSLGTLWAEQGHEVFFGSRTPDKGKAVAESAGRGFQGGSNNAAAEFGEVLLYTAQGTMPSELFSSPQLLDGKTIIDCNNRQIPENFAYGPLVDASLMITQSKSFLIRSWLLIPNL